MSLPSRNISVQTYPYLNSGVLLKEDGFALLTEDGNEILLENPRQDANLSTRNVSSFNSLTARN